MFPVIDAQLSKANLNILMSCSYLFVISVKIL